MANFGPRPNRRLGEVPLAKLRRDIDRAYDAWAERRGMTKPSFDPVFARTPSRGAGSSLAQVAAAIVAMERPAHGLMKRMAKENGLNYWSLSQKVCKLRRSLGRSPRRSRA